MHIRCSGVRKIQRKVFRFEHYDLVLAIAMRDVTKVGVGGRAFVPTVGVDNVLVREYGLLAQGGKGARCVLTVGYHVLKSASYPPNATEFIQIKKNKSYNLRYDISKSNS